MVHIENDVKLDFKDVLIRPKRSTLRSRAEVDIKRTIVFKHTKKTWTGVPVMVANMDTTGTFEMVKTMAGHGMFVAVHKHYTVAEWSTFLKANPECISYLAASAGTSEADFAKLKEICDIRVPCPNGGEDKMVEFACLDVANGYSEHFVECVRRVRRELPHLVVIAGNVVTGEMTEELILSGADIVKVGIGPGSVCITRKQTGVGYPQLSAVMECADAAHGLGGCVVSDGGCTCPGDFAKAFGAGADFVMSGGMFSGHEESGGDLIERNGKKYKLFYGMSSDTAMKKHAGGVAEYRASEGKTVEVPYKGPVESTILDIAGGLRSCCTYVGAAKLKELARRTTFIKCTAQLNQVYAGNIEHAGEARSATKSAAADGAPPSKKART